MKLAERADEIDAGFVADPAWKKLSSLPQYRDDQIVSNISNLILKPLTASQI